MQPEHLSFDFDAEVLYTPDPKPDPSYIYDYMHEWCHAQLAEGVPGIVLEHLRGVIDCVRNSISHQVLAWSEDVLGLDEAERLEMELEGKLPRLERAALATWVELLGDPKFQGSIEIFLELNRRRKRLLDAFRGLHEGVAIHTAISLPLTELEDPTNWLGSVVTILQNDSGQVAPDDLRPRLSKLARRELERWNHGIYGSDHLEGTQLLCTICQPGENFDDAWLFALAALHIPYAGTSPFDLDAKEFDRWVDGYSRRFNNLLQHPSRLMDLAAEVRRNGSVDSSVEKQLLQLAAPDDGLVSGAPMGGWLRSGIWESGLFRKFLELYGVERKDISAVLAPLEENYPDDRSSSFTLTRYGNPARIDNAGRIRGRDEDGVRIVQDRIEMSCRIAALEKILLKLISSSSSVTSGLTGTIFSR